MATWNSSASISAFLTLEDIADTHITQDSTHDTPVLKLVAEARSRGYDVVCLPLTTEKWQKRWKEMCLLPAESDNGRNASAEQSAEAWRLRPAFNRDEVTITRLGACLRFPVALR